MADISPDLLKTCHGSAVNDIVFPRSTSALFATGGKGDVRIWQTDSGKELRRIEVPNITCNAGTKYMSHLNESFYNFYV